MSQPTNWRKSSYSTETDSCVEIATGGDATCVRDTKNRPAGHLTFGPAAWNDLLKTVTR